MGRPDKYSAGTVVPRASLVLRNFIPDFTTVAHPLIRLTEKEVRFEWGEEQQQAFDTLKCLLTTAPVLAYPQILESILLILMPVNMG